MKVTCFCTTHTYTWLHNVCVVGGAAATAESAISKMKCTQQNCKNIHIFVIFGLWMSGRKKTFDIFVVIIIVIVVIWTKCTQKEENQTEINLF